MRNRKDNADWLDVLASECKRSSQAAVGRRLGVSSTMISQALNGLYPSPVGLEKLRRKVLGAYMGAEVNCPVLGEIPRDLCEEYQGKPFSSHSPIRVQLFRACPDCANNQESQA